MLKTGEQLNCESGAQVSVGDVLGVGGQGEVREGRMSDGRAVAIKWYYPQFQNADLRESITTMVREKAPSAHFLWPEDIVVRGDHFGYLMPLRPPNHASLTKVLGRKVSIRFRELVQAAGNTVAAFKALQAKGLFYCDISDGNLFVDPATGDVLICDNDNVGSNRTAPRVLGTPRFMAPEIVRGDARPSALTDSFSMSVLLFLLLINDHPLQGATESKIHVLDARAMRKIYGTDPVFIFDPHDESNRPVPGVHVNAPAFWPLYPESVRRIFTRVFTAGLTDPGKRPTFGEWETTLAAASDAIYTCAQCGRQNFYCPERTDAACWGCRRVLGRPLRLLIDGRSTVVMNPDSLLYPRHTNKRGDTTPGNAPTAEVSKHPTQDVHGLRNLSERQWYATPNGAANARTVAPGQSIALVPGTRIDFGALHAVVER
ncbi:protein kinase domain-containing protein [Lentzea sp. E54]|uniref:protein kinase domain-containing protein n=1 Tax=Lentzea xerophila TaxID=3435883 RepID=UPI003DA480C4